MINYNFDTRNIRALIYTQSMFNGVQKQIANATRLTVAVLYSIASFDIFSMMRTRLFPRLGTPFMARAEQTTPGILG